MFEEVDQSPSIFQYIKNFFSVRLFIQVIIFLSGLMISGFGLFQLFGNSAQVSNENIDNKGEITSICQKDPEFGLIVVDMGGAVKNPGVYELDTGSRVNDLVSAAGGFSSSVDKYYINKVLNLSQLLTDGEKFYIPTIEESIQAQENLSIKKIATNTADKGDIISINSASKTQLTNLVGIGEKRAGDIISGRPYDSIQQLVENDIITDSVFEKIKNNISL